MRLHRSSTWMITLALLLVCIGAPAILAQGIQGRLLDQATDKPIAGATVSLITEPDARAVASTRTSDDGSFALTAPSPGVYRLMAAVTGYRTAVSPAIQLTPGLTVNFTWRIYASAYRLVPIVVTESNRRPSGAQTDFYSRIRQRAKMGHLITRDQIERLHPFRVSDLLRTVPGIQVIPAAFGDEIRTMEGCTPAVFLDGIQFPLMGESIDNIVSPNDVEMIEVYPHAAGAPVELTGPGSACGVVAIWTRRG